MKNNAEYTPSAAVSTLAEYLNSRIESVRSPEIPFCDVRAKAVSESVAAFLNPGECARFRDSDITLLLSRALWSVGCEAMAQRLLEIRNVEAEMPDRMEIVSGSPGSFMAWRSLIAAGAVDMPSSSLVDGKWVLTFDLKRLFMRESEKLEITMFRGLCKLMEVTACIWDESNGRGILGLRNISVAASDFFGLYGKKKALFVREVIGFCCEKMAITSADRSWKHTPQVINLDLRRL